MAGSSGWPESRKPNRGHYSRSESAPQDLEEFGLRTDISNCIGVTTVVKSTNGSCEGDHARKPSGLKRCGSQRVLNNSKSESRLKDDSSEDFLPMQKSKGDWDVTRTMEITTSQEVRPSRSAF